MFNLNNNSISGSILRNLNESEVKPSKGGFADLKKTKSVKPRVTGADKIAIGKENNKAKCIKESDAIADILGKKYNLTEEQSKELSGLIEKAFIQPLAEAETGYEGEDKFEWLKHQFENKTWAEVNPETHRVENIQPGDTNTTPGKGTTQEPKIEKVDGRETGASDIAKDDAKDKAKCIKEGEECEDCNKELTEEVIVESELNQIEGDELAFENTVAEVLAHIADKVGPDAVIAADYGDGAKLYYKSTPEADFDTAVDIQVTETKGDEDKTITTITGETDLDALVDRIKSQISAEEPTEEPTEDIESTEEPAEDVEPTEEPADSESIEDIDEPEEPKE